MIFTNRSHWKVNAIVSCLTLLDSSKALFANHGIAIPDEVTPVVNARIIELGCQTWELMAGDRIEPPRYNPGFCRTRWCPHAAIAHVYCYRCCKVRYNVEVWRSNEVDRDGSSQLGVFACKSFSQEYVCDWSWDTQTGDDRTSIIVVSANEQCRFVLKIEDPKEGLLQADARTMGIGKQKAAGVGRYVVPRRSESNVSFQGKDGCLDTWGFKVKRGSEIQKGEEIVRSLIS